MLVITPTGINTGENNILLKVSQRGKKTAPAKAEAGIKITLLVPIIFLIICGIIKPTKPITPQIETVAAVIKDAVRNKNFVFLSIFIPKVFDFSPPKDTALITFPDKDKIIMLVSTPTVINGSNLSSKVEKFPISHKKAACTLFSGDSANISITADEKI
jgi:hypothetical protein